MVRGYEKQSLIVPAIVNGKQDGVIRISAFVALGTGLALCREENGYVIITKDGGIPLLGQMAAPTRLLAQYWLEEVVATTPIRWDGTCTYLKHQIRALFPDEQCFHDTVIAAYRKACERVRLDEEREEQDESQVELQRQIRSLTLRLEQARKALKEAYSVLEGEE